VTTAHLWNAMTVNALITHLWQSTAFAGLGWLLTMALRNYRARTRFSVWVAVSIKFLVPFALLIALGSNWAVPKSEPVTHGTIYKVIEEINEPFSSIPLRKPHPGLAVHRLVGRPSISIALASIWLFGGIMILIRWTRQRHRARRLVNQSAALDEGREVFALRQAESRLRVRKPIPVLATSKRVEPGIFGVVRPVLIWPAGLSERMDDAHIAAIFAHELEHVRRRDNLTAALHTLVTAVFWFHPAVWWIGVKMTEERERACDEGVLEQNAEPQTYAESILKVCAFCLESPLSCVAGFSGLDLRKRVLRITSHSSGSTLTFGHRALLLAALILAVTLPIGFGVVRGQSSTENSRTPKSNATGALDLQEIPTEGNVGQTNPAAAPAFEVSTIKPNKNSDMIMLRYTPDGIFLGNVTLEFLMKEAFRVEDDRLENLPDWARKDRFDVQAKVAEKDVPVFQNLKLYQKQQMLIALLADRFGLICHQETRELHTYVLLIAKNGPKMRQSTTEQDEPDPNGKHTLPLLRMEGTKIEASGAPIESLVRTLSGILESTVIDQTGLAGRYDYTLQWSSDDAVYAPIPNRTESSGVSPPGHDRPSLSTAIQEELGLRLVKQKAPIDVIVIDHVMRPSPN
jgi:bla regulator protein blaR1